MDFRNKLILNIDTTKIILNQTNKYIISSRYTYQVSEYRTIVGTYFYYEFLLIINYTGIIVCIISKVNYVQGYYEYNRK